MVSKRQEAGNSFCGRKCAGLGGVDRHSARGEQDSVLSVCRQLAVGGTHLGLLDQQCVSWLNAAAAVDFCNQCCQRPLVQSFPMPTEDPLPVCPFVMRNGCSVALLGGQAVTESLCCVGCRTRRRSSRKMTLCMAARRSLLTWCSTPGGMTSC